MVKIREHKYSNYHSNFLVMELEIALYGDLNCYPRIQYIANYLNQSRTKFGLIFVGIESTYKNKVEVYHLRNKFLVNMTTVIKNNVS